MSLWFFRENTIERYAGLVVIDYNKKQRIDESPFEF